MQWFRWPVGLPKKKSSPMGCVLHVQFQWDVFYILPFSNFTPVMRVRKIKGDGNCFFCCISYVITGDEDSHEQVRQMVCSYIEDSESTVLYGNNQTGLQYLSASKMKNAGVWGAIDEILATANLLQLTILVQSPKSLWSTTCMAEECSKVTMVHDLHGRRMLQSHYGPRLAWQKNAPRKAPDSPFAIYLDNSSGCHFEVVVSVENM